MTTNKPENQSEQPAESTKARRVHLDLSPKDAALLQKHQDLSGLAYRKIFEQGVDLLADIEQAGGEFRIQSPDGTKRTIKIL